MSHRRFCQVIPRRQFLLRAALTLGRCRPSSIIRSTYSEARRCQRIGALPRRRSGLLPSRSIAGGGLSVVSHIRCLGGGRNRTHQTDKPVACALMLASGKQPVTKIGRGAGTPIPGIAASKRYFAVATARCDTLLMTILRCANRATVVLCAEIFLRVVGRKPSDNITRALTSLWEARHSYSAIPATQ